MYYKNNLVNKTPDNILFSYRPYQIFMPDGRSMCHRRPRMAVDSQQVLAIE